MKIRAGHAQVSGRGFDKFKVQRDRHVKITSVPCPVCLVGVGEVCIGFTTAAAHHRPRRIMAVRAERAT